MHGVHVSEALCRYILSPPIYPALPNGRLKLECVQVHGSAISLPEFAKLLLYFCITHVGVWLPPSCHTSKREKHVIAIREWRFIIQLLLLQVCAMRACARASSILCAVPKADAMQFTK